MYHKSKRLRNTYKLLSVIHCVPITIYTDMCQQWPSYFEIFWIMQALMFTNLSHETYFISIFNFQPKQRKKVYALHIRDNHDINYINAACWKSLMQSKYMYIIIFVLHAPFFFKQHMSINPMHYLAFKAFTDKCIQSNMYDSRP